MTNFVQSPVNRKSLISRKPVHGVGVNDADYLTTTTTKGVHHTCPIYRTWLSMIGRCYSDSPQACYLECRVSNFWLLFSNFRSWMVDQDWEGKCLDKDIIKTGNKVYGPDACIFVSRQINGMLTAKKSNRGHCSTGVTFTKGRYQAAFSASGKRVHLGRFDTDSEACEAYLSFKSKHVLSVALFQEQPLKGYLIRISKEIASGEYFK